MADNKIEIVASLNIPESVSTVGKDLKQVADRINSEKGLKITCNIDLSKTTQRIQSQLTTLSKNLNLNVPKITFGADTSGIQDSAKKAADGAKQAKNEVNNITRSIDIAVDEMKAKLATKFGVESNKIITDFSKNAKEELNKVSLTVTKVTGEVEKFEYSIEKLKNKGEIKLSPIGSSGTDRGIIQTMAKAAKEADNQEIRLQNLQAKFTDPNASKPILQTANQELLAAEYEKAAIAVNALRNADASTFQQMEYNAKVAVNNYNNLATAIRNAETAATDMRSKPIEVIQAEQVQKLEQFISKIASSGIKDVSELTAEAERLKAVLSNPLDASGIKSYLNDFAKLEAQFQSLNQQAKAFSGLKSQINKAISSLNTQSNTSSFRTNMTDSGVQAQVAAINDLRSKYQSLFAEIQNAQTPQAFVAIQQKLVELSPLFDKVTADTQNLKNTLADNKAIVTFANNIAKTESSLNKFAATNQKAINSLNKMSNGQTFQQNWKQMIDSLKDPDLNAEKLRQINQQFQIFKNEASAAGLTSSSFFKSMANQIQMVAARWLSLYTVIGKTKEMINNVINLDNAMTNLKRVTDETAASYENFVELSNRIASDTHTTMTDAVEQAARWAKAGYNDPAEAAELAKTSLIYSIVGDVDNDTAVNDMVTALRGFNMTAEESIEIVDKLDILNNNYSTDAKSLGEGLSRSASAMAAANNTLDETLALLTGGTEITQNAAEMGASLKVISMRIRGMRGELEQLGEESEGIESISKIQTQILNLTNGKVNIFDSNDNFRSTYAILKDISEVFNDLSDPDRANLTEILFGKLRANQGLAIMDAFESGRIAEAMEDIADSEGTALAEIDKYGESITAHTTEFRNQWQNLSNDFFDSDFLKDAIDFGTTFVNVLNQIVKKFGSLGTVITAVVGISAFKGAGRQENIPNMPNYALLQNVHNDSHLLKNEFFNCWKLLKPNELQRITVWVTA